MWVEAVASAMFRVWLCLVPVLLTVASGPAAQSNPTGDEKINITEILNSFFDKGYDKRVRPNYGGPPVNVGVTMYILSISSVNEVQMDFTLDFYFRQSWKDDRLAFKTRHALESLTVGAEVADLIWVPDTFFANEKTAYFHQATTPNTFLRIRSGGEVFRSMRLTVTNSCPMDLRYFPMDRQQCTVEVESFGYTMRDIRYYWLEHERSIKMSSDVELPQFKVVGHRQRSKEVPLTTGNYSRLICEIQFIRSMGYYLIQIYIPAGLIVIISWVSFWLHRNATPARVALGVTTVLTMTTLMSSTNAALPKISYIKSIDVYLGTCFVMVFASLLEYATVGYLGKRIAMRKTRTQLIAKIAEQHRQRCLAHHAAAAAASTADGGPGDAAHSKKEGTEVRLKMADPKCYSSKTSTLENPINLSYEYDAAAFCKNTNKLFGVSPSDIDKYSRVVFPVCFVCFNLMYWIIYLHISDVLDEGIVPLGSK
ncbi:gamma-aminobutyric acid receptor subunit beta-like [Uloborus diversus]|uniref:gamma-aminobutyric acid receptor subunit beta-like n=1 Tax=Uloborus diversus TaxID=327109 RepID=UPI002409C0E7|nr:gamma-aminobutyric acid receptor subunit beta-like [Uloborus diversus]